MNVNKIYEVQKNMTNRLHWIDRMIRAPTGKYATTDYTSSADGIKWQEIDNGVWSTRVKRHSIATLCLIPAVEWQNGNGGIRWIGE